MVERVDNNWAGLKRRRDPRPPIWDIAPKRPFSAGFRISEKNAKYPSKISLKIFVFQNVPLVSEPRKNMVWRNIFFDVQVGRGPWTTRWPAAVRPSTAGNRRRYGPSRVVGKRFYFAVCRYVKLLYEPEVEIFGTMTVSDNRE